MKAEIKISVFSDITCPWCFIGKRRLEKATDILRGEFNFKIKYFPFELNPYLPKEGVDQELYLSKKFGGIERYEETIEHVSKIASEEGLHFDLKKQKTSPNTKEAHRLIWLAEVSGIQLEMVEQLFKAYFSEGVDLSKISNLVKVAKQTGLNEKYVEDFLKSDEGTAEVDSFLNSAHKLGISGVPFYIFNNEFGISGAQPADVFVKLIKESIIPDRE